MPQRSLGGSLVSVGVGVGLGAVALGLELCLSSGGAHSHGGEIHRISAIATLIVAACAAGLLVALLACIDFAGIDVGATFFVAVFGVFAIVGIGIVVQAVMLGGHANNGEYVLGAFLAGGVGAAAAVGWVVPTVVAHVMQPVLEEDAADL